MGGLPANFRTLGIPLPQLSRPLLPGGRCA